ncbi:MAG: OmpA family protein [bacterium]
MKYILRPLLFLLFVAFFAQLVAQELPKKVKPKYIPSKDIKWNMFGLNRVHVQDFSITDQYIDTCNCGESRPGFLSKANVSVNLGFYSNLSKRWAVSGDLGLGYGSYLRKDPTVVEEKYRGRFRTQTFRVDAYYHFSDPKLQLQSYAFAGLHFSQRNPNWMTIPIGLGARYMVFNDNAMLTAQVGYGFGRSGSIKNSIVYSWGLYVNSSRKKRVPPTVPTATIADAFVQTDSIARRSLDADLDGVVNDVDQCPNIAGPVSNNGCPIADRDKDGVADSLDRCPDMPSNVGNDGCPVIDRDRDGIVDSIDQCPDQPGSLSNKGCPGAPAPTTEKTYPQQISNTGDKIAGGDTVQFIIYFDFDKYDLTKTSFEILNDAIDFLKRNDDYSVYLIGHTDLEGNVAYNIKLSKSRVSTTSNYLLSYGIEPTRISTSFHGKSSPLITTYEKNLAWKNRRVEIFLIKK